MRYTKELFFTIPLSKQFALRAAGNLLFDALIVAPLGVATVHRLELTQQEFAFIYKKKNQRSEKIL